MVSNMMPVKLCEPQRGDYSPSSAHPANVHAGEGIKKSKTIQEPQDHGNDHNRIQDRLNGSCHWYIAIHQPEENTNHD